MEQLIMKLDFNLALLYLIMLQISECLFFFAFSCPIDILDEIGREMFVTSIIPIKENWIHTRVVIDFWGRKFEFYRA